MEMRLGKTLTMIRFLQRRCKGNILIVAPNSALGSWMNELRQEGVPASDISDLSHGKPEKRLQRMEEGRRWNLINKEGWLPLPEIGDPGRFDAVVLDESTFIKSPDAGVTHFFLKNFRECRFRYCLTGTPNPESELDFVCQFLFTHGDFLRFEKFYEFKFTKYHRHAKLSWLMLPNPGVREQVKEEVFSRSIIIRRKDVGMDKVKVRESRYFDLDAISRRVYDKLETDFILEIENREEERLVWKLEQYMRLRQIASGLDPDGNQLWNGKLNGLGELLKTELVDDKVVVWFSFRWAAIHAWKWFNENKVPAELMLGGKTAQEREDLRKKFQSKRGPRVLCVQEQAAMTGMDLSSASVAVYFSEPCGLLTKQQTEDRILHLTKEGPLLYLELITRNTVEEDIHAALQSKHARSDRMLSSIIGRNLQRRYHNG